MRISGNVPSDASSRDLQYQSACQFLPTWPARVVFDQFVSPTAIERVSARRRVGRLVPWNRCSTLQLSERLFSGWEFAFLQFIVGFVFNYKHRHRPSLIDLCMVASMAQHRTKCSARPKTASGPKRTSGVRAAGCHARRRKVDLARSKCQKKHRVFTAFCSETGNAMVGPPRG